MNGRGGEIYLYRNFSNIQVFFFKYLGILFFRYEKSYRLFFYLTLKKSNEINPV